MIKAPWTEEQVKALNEYQKAGAFHPFTCGNNSNHRPGHLIATPNGWVCLECGYTQDWAHEFMMTEEAKTNWATKWLEGHNAKELGDV